MCSPCCQLLSDHPDARVLRIPGRSDSRCPVDPIGRASAPAGEHPATEWRRASHWEGNTLVVDTTNFSARSMFMGAAEHLHLTERFTRVAPDLIKYEITRRSDDVDETVDGRDQAEAQA
jgi:hypothetical protein